MKILWLLLSIVLVFIRNYGDANEKYRLMKVESLLDLLKQNIINMNKMNFNATPNSEKTPDKDNDPLWSVAWTNVAENPPESITAYEGDRVELNCTADGGPPPTVLWITKHNVAKQFGELLKDAFSFGKEDGLARVHTTYVIECATPMDTGLIYCLSITEDKMKLSTPTRLIVHKRPGGRDACIENIVQIKPTIVLHTSMRLSEIGTTVVLPCKFVGAGNSIPIWIYNGKEIEVDKQKYFINEDHSLVINTITWFDMGQYTCKVRVNNTDTEANTFLYPMAPEGTDQQNETNSSTASTTSK